MAFCNECGADLQGAKFCANCGTAVQDLLIQQRESALSANTNIRQASIAECKKMIQYFSQKTKTWEKYEQVSEDVRRGRSFWHVFLFLIGLTWLGIGCVFVYMMFHYNPEITLIETIVGLAGLSFYFLVPSLPFFIISSRLNKKSKAKYAELLLLQDALSMEIVEHYEAYGYCHVGLQYTREKILKEICKNIEDGRCSTIDVALNIMLDDEDKKSMQQQAEEILKASERAANAAEASLLFDVMDHL